jgi:hypothetical protein
MVPGVINHQLTHHEPFLGRGFPKKKDEKQRRLRSKIDLLSLSFSLDMCLVGPVETLSV